jgi:hypothetical protein
VKAQNLEKIINIIESCFPEKSKFVKKVEEMKKKEEEISVNVASVLKRNIKTESSNPTPGLSRTINLFQ